MKSKRRPVFQFEIDEERLVDAIARKVIAALTPVLTGKAAAERDSETAQGLNEFCTSIGISLTMARRQIAAGKLEARKIGDRVIITADAKRRYLAALPLKKMKTKERAATTDGPKVENSNSHGFVHSPIR
jgi:hypothetical protein